MNEELQSDNMTNPTNLLFTCLIAVGLVAPSLAIEVGNVVESPDGRLRVVVTHSDDGAPRYAVELEGETVLQPSQLGLVRDDADCTRSLRLTSVSDSRQVSDEYEILTAKRRHNSYVANERVFHYETPGGKPLDIEFRVSDDGVAFRYRFPNKDAAVHKINRETTSFHFPSATKAWLQPMSVAKTGWEATNPCYEEFYRKEISVDTPSPTGAGWVFPALFRTSDETWVLLSEAGLGRNYCGCRLASDSPDGEYRIAFPDPREGFPGGGVNPSSTLPWATPWRIIVVGSLSTVAESMLGVHLAAPPVVDVDPSDLPGKSSWSWVLLRDHNTTFPVQKRFIDFSANMGMQYCLIDCTWDTQIGEEKLADLVEKGQQQDVKIIVWYNSAGSWNTTPYTPRDKMLTHESRVAEFKKLKQTGSSGT